MVIDTRVLAYPKPEPRATTKRRLARLETRVKRSVRAQCVARDGYCLLAGWHVCQGPSEWAHAHSHRRSQTRGQAPEQRHQLASSMMLCRSAHRAYDAHDTATVRAVERRREFVR